MIRNTAAVRTALAARMTFSDRVCFASAATLASDTGLHPCTVRRTISRLERDRVIERVPFFTVKGRKVRSCAWRFRIGVRRMPKCSTTKQSFRKPRTTTQPLRGWRSCAAPRRTKNYAWRVLVGEVVPINDSQPSRNTSPGQALFAAIVDSLADRGVCLPRGVIAVAARHGSASLEDGVDPDVVLAGCLVAIKQGKGRYALDYIAEMALAKAGQHMNRQQYLRELESFKSGNDPALQRITQAMDEIARRKTK